MKKLYMSFIYYFCLFLILAYCILPFVFLWSIKDYRLYNTSVAILVVFVFSFFKGLPKEISVFLCCILAFLLPYFILYIDINTSNDNSYIFKQYKLLDSVLAVLLPCPIYFLDLMFMDYIYSKCKEAKEGLNKLKVKQK